MPMPIRSRFAALAAGLIAMLCVGYGATAVGAPLNPNQQSLFDIYKELIEINTTDSVGDTTQAARAMAKRLIDGGFPAADVQVVMNPGNAKKGNVVARLRGDGSGKPILLLAHLDVVEAKKEDWSADLDPFKLIERDGFYYGRGTTDDKAMAAIFVTNLIRLHKEGFKPKRDLILALTADEEGGNFNGAAFLIQNHGNLVDAAFGLNEGGGGRSLGGKPLFNGVQASEKVYRDFELEVTNPGGHSSLPTKDNAIYRLARGLDRLGQFDFPVDLNEVTRTFFERTAAIETGQTAADMKTIAQTNGADAAAVTRLSQTPMYNSMLRTTCVATLIEGGHAHNALPQRATANVNCRILPQQTAEQVEATLKRVLADDQIKLSRGGTLTSNATPPSPLSPAIMAPIEELSKKMWNVSTIPLMSTGATDSAPFRAAGIPMYGVSGVFGDINDVRAHGRDERVGVQQLYDAQEFLYQLVKRYAASK
jgi:acetylornithine deacetylase/succinyl-diaminopimelate desuccinylase-like protein